MKGSDIMTKDEFAKGWKHFCNGINWDDTYLDAEAIQNQLQEYL